MDFVQVCCTIRAQHRPRVLSRVLQIVEVQFLEMKELSAIVSDSNMNIRMSFSMQSESLWRIEALFYRKIDCQSDGRAGESTNRSAELRPHRTREPPDS